MKIVIYSNTFTQIEAEASEYWLLLRFRLAVEYLNRPPIPSPLILIWHMMLLIRFLLVSLCKCRCVEPLFNFLEISTFTGA